MEREWVLDRLLQLKLVCPSALWILARTKYGGIDADHQICHWFDMQASSKNFELLKDFMASFCREGQITVDDTAPGHVYGYTSELLRKTLKEMRHGSKTKAV